jgi:hypothetical protein
LKNVGPPKIATCSFLPGITYTASRWIASSSRVPGVVPVRARGVLKKNGCGTVASMAMSLDTLKRVTATATPRFLTRRMPAPMSNIGPAFTSYLLVICRCSGSPVSVASERESENVVDDACHPALPLM